MNGRADPLTRSASAGALGHPSLRADFSGPPGGREPGFARDLPVARLWELVFTPAPAASEIREPSSGDDLVEALAAELVQAWGRGERPVVEVLFDRHPELWDRPDAALVLIFEELCLRREFDEPTTRDEFLLRFPRWRARIEILLDCHRLLAPRAAVVRQPTPGETVGDFRIVADLGRGGRGRVVLATQRALADRPVVLKLIPADGQEHLSLARLQHTHIMPLYAVHDQPSRGRRVLCMPYFGNLTLARLLRRLGEIAPAKRTGRDLLDALERSRQSSPLPLAGGGPAARFLARASYVQAACWLAACLADALQYAHERGLVHLDVKPSNVLVAADGQPMLLDFHLARDPIPAGFLPSGRLGGTPLYMAPEHGEAMRAFTTDELISTPVDGRADVYALGLVVYEVLGGSVPIPSDDPLGALAKANPRVDRGLRDILKRCLEQDPDDRYPDAATLAADLRRHLNDLPLRGVSNRGLVGRWRRSRPHALAVLTAAALIVTTAALAPNPRGRSADGPIRGTSQADRRPRFPGVRHPSPGHRPPARRR